MCLDLIPGDMKIEEVYGINRSFRQESESRAIKQSMSDTEIELTNRQRTTETNERQLPRSSMKEYYLKICLLRKRFLVYSSNL